MIKTEDFQYMWRGQVKQTLPKEDAYRLEPVLIENGKHQRALLLLHGFSSTPAVYRLMTPKLQGYDAISCPVLPGHAENIEAFAKVQMDHWLKTTERAYLQLQQNYNQVDVLGLSLGGLLAINLASKFSVHHLYLLNPALILRMNRKLALFLAKTLSWLGFKYIPNKAGNLHVHEHFELTYKKLPLSAIVNILTLIEQVQSLTFSCPTDLFLGIYDEVVDVEEVSKKFKKFSNIKQHWLHNSAHVLPIDGDVKTIIDLINKDYLL